VRDVDLLPPRPHGVSAPPLKKYIATAAVPGKPRAPMHEVPANAIAVSECVVENRALTGIRGVAALWVVLFHLPLPLASAELHALQHRGYLGVDLFFILSGFVLAYVYRAVLPARIDAREARRFYLIRLARIYPLHFATLALLVAVELVKLAVRGSAFGDDRSPLSLLTSLLLVHAWGVTGLGWNLVAWSISTEWLAYLVFPVTFALARKLSVWSCLLGIAATIVTLMLLEHHKGDLNSTTGLAMIRCAAEFHMGMFLSQLIYRSGGTSGLAKLALDACTFGALLLVIACLCWSGRDVLVVVGLGVLVALLFDPRSALAQLLAHRIVHHLGTISYSIYMLQYIVTLFVERCAAIVGGLGPAERLLAVLVVLVPSAELSYRFVERAARNKIRIKSWEASPAR
jgi:peptidoglycan/LPS O-acetylase OafA/YrhL